MNFLLDAAKIWQILRRNACKIKSNLSFLFSDPNNEKYVTRWLPLDIDDKTGAHFVFNETNSGMRENFANGNMPKYEQMFTHDYPKKPTSTSQLSVS